MPSAGGPLAGRALVEIGVASVTSLMKRNPVRYGRETHCNNLATARFRQVSGFTSADKAECCLQFRRPRVADSLRDTSESSVCHCSASPVVRASVVNLLYDQQ